MHKPQRQSPRSHDVLTLIDRRGLGGEIKAAPLDLGAYVRDELVKLQADRSFETRRPLFLCRGKVAVVGRC